MVPVNGTKKNVTARGMSAQRRSIWSGGHGSASLRFQPEQLQRLTRSACYPHLHLTLPGAETHKLHL